MVVLVGVVYYTAMNTIAATWSGGLRERIGELGLRIERLGLRLCAWSVAKKQREKDMEMKPEVKRELLAQLEDAKQGKNLSPRFTSLEDAFAYLDEETRKYKEGKGGQ